MRTERQITDDARGKVIEVHLEVRWIAGGTPKVEEEEWKG